jgi:hypothetical protein
MELYGERELEAFLRGCRAVDPDAIVEPAHVNGASGLAVRSRGRIVAILPAEVRVEGIERAWVIAERDRLAGWDR